jgi:hypothetical protein
MPVRRQCPLCLVKKNRIAYYELHQKTKNLTCTIVRDNGCHNKYQSSKYCIFCQELLKVMNFKKVQYTNELGEIEIKRTKDLDSTHYSKAQKVLQLTRSDNHPHINWCKILGIKKKSYPNNKVYDVNCKSNKKNNRYKGIKFYNI